MRAKSLRARTRAVRGNRFGVIVVGGRIGQGTRGMMPGGR
jgi:hypothetical protein